MGMTEIEGRVTRISGPIVYAEGLDACALYDVVEVGERAVTGEIIRMKHGMATLQVYEDVTGMTIGEKVISRRRPLSVKLGPGLIGTIYDGIQRPLERLFLDTGAFLQAGVRSEPLDLEKRWNFQPADGVQSGCAIFPGMPLGTVQETASVQHSILVPPFIRNFAAGRNTRTKSSSATGPSRRLTST